MLKFHEVVSVLSGIWAIQDTTNVSYAIQEVTPAYQKFSTVASASKTIWAAVKFKYKSQKSSVRYRVVPANIC